MSQQPTLTTTRLNLRPFALADAPDVQRLAGDRAIAEMTASIPHPYPDGAAEEWIGTHQEAFDKGIGVCFAIVEKQQNALVGSISLMKISAGHQAELGYWIGKPFWSNGYCTEAAREVVCYGFEQRGLVRIHACHIGRNPASGRILQKLGMQQEGCRRRHVRRWDCLEDLEMYGILKEDWENL